MENEKNCDTIEMVLKEVREIREILTGQIKDGAYQDGFITLTNNKIADHERRIIALETIPKAVKSMSFSVAVKMVEKAALWIAVGLSAFFSLTR